MEPASSSKRRRLHQYSVLFLTFLAYMSYHATRKVPSTIKTVLHPLSSNGAPTFDRVKKPGWAPFSNDVDPYFITKHGYDVSGAGTKAVNGKYSCTHKKKDLCVIYTKAAEGGDGAFSLELGNFTEFLSKKCTNVACWAFRDQNGSAYYYQEDAFPIPAEKSSLSDVYKWKLTALTQGNDIPVLEAAGTTDGKVLLGLLDTVYLAFYAVSMFFMGSVAEKVPKRPFLVFGMVGTSVLVVFVALEYWFKTHSFAYWAAIYALQGTFQSTGWPTVVGIVGNWCGHGSRGLIMGIWNAHTSVGNIVGSLLATAALNVGGAGDLGAHGANWTMSFILSACMMFAIAVLIFFLLVERPEDAGLEKFAGKQSAESGEDAEDAEKPRSVLRVGYSVLNQPLDEELNSWAGSEGESDFQNMSMYQNMRAAVAIPGVVEFSLCLMFAKCIAYTFIYWTPYYLSHNGFSTATAGYLCTFVDVGGILGGIVAGLASDRSKKYASVAIVFLLLTIPGLFFYHALSDDLKATSKLGSALLMMMVGFLVNGPYALITTAVSADLGQHKSLQGNAGLMSVVTAIIDGCGSIGAAMQGYLVGWISATYGWNQVFTFLMICCAISALCLVRLVLKEWGFCAGRSEPAHAADDDDAYDALPDDS